MIYSNFFVVPESKLDEQFIEEEMTFLIANSIHKRSNFKDKYEYAETIKNYYNNWMLKDISIG